LQCGIDYSYLKIDFHYRGTREATCYAIYALGPLQLVHLSRFIFLLFSNLFYKHYKINIYIVTVYIFFLNN